MKADTNVLAADRCWNGGGGGEVEECRSGGNRIKMLFSSECAGSFLFEDAV